MIVVQTLMDEAAYPWQARVVPRGSSQQVLGAKTDDQFRLWFVDHAMHTAPADAGWRCRRHAVAARRASSTTAACSSRRCATWRPGSSTASRRPPARRTSVVDGQVLVPPTRRGARGASSRSSTLTANGGAPCRRRRGRRGRLRRPRRGAAGAGTIVRAEWDFDGPATSPSPRPSSTAVVGPCSPRPHLRPAGHVLPRRADHVTPQRRRRDASRAGPEPRSGPRRGRAALTASEHHINQFTGGP